MELQRFFMGKVMEVIRLIFNKKLLLKRLENFKVIKFNQEPIRAR